MIPTKIRREVLKQATMYRLDYLTSQLPSRDQAYLIGRRLGRASQMRCFQLLITEIQLTHQQLAIIQRNEYK